MDIKWTKYYQSLIFLVQEVNTCLILDQSAAIHLKSKSDFPLKLSVQVGWLDARNICRHMCMDLVSVETPEENTMVENIVSKFGVDGVWTSGRLCNFHGCDVSSR